MGSRSTSLFGLWGIVLLAFGLVAYAVAPAASGYVLVHVGLGLLLLVLYLTASRESLSTFLGERSTKYGANAVAYSLIFVAILVALNYLAARHNHRFDLTKENVFSLSSQSTNVLSTIDKAGKPVTVYAFTEGGMDPIIDDLLDSYKNASNNFSYRMVDPVKDRDLAERYKVTEIPFLFIEYGDPAGEDKRTATVTRDISEESITNGLIKATAGTKKMVCFLDGHGEADPENRDARGASALQDALRNENYDTRKVLLASEASVPAECSIFVIAATERPLFDHEVTQIREYLKKGGSALFLVPPSRGQQLGELLQPWGVKLTDTVVVDQVVRLFQGPALGLQILASTYGTHPITQGFTERTIFPMARAVQADAAGKPGVSAIEIVKSSPSAWAESDVEGVFKRGEAAQDDKDIKGPVSLAVAVTGKHKEMGFDKEGETKLVVVGDADFASNQFFGQLFNRDLVLNMMAWLGGEEQQISIRPRAIQASRAQLGPAETRRIFYLSVLVLPELLLFLGLTVWWRRSTK
ncbi:MAG: GldG family protein [Deltaproteobacteria bacterium]|nr:GldG family protein [Deltaproteobacteria bacterium]